MKNVFYLFLFLLVFFLSVGYKSEVNNSFISKIYLKDSLLIKCEKQNNIKFFDVSNPSSPAVVSSINIKGNYDAAVYDSYLYADSYEDLIIYNIYNASSPKAVDTIKKVFQQIYFPGVYNDGYGGSSGCNCSSSEVSPVSDFSGGTGRGGSLARFTIAKKYLYCVDGSDLHVFDLVYPSYPQFKKKINVGWDIETIYSYKDYLFIGGMNGMYIYGIIDPQNPVTISEFTHARACDPVVVEDTLAYVTLRSGTACGPSQNALHVLSVSNLFNPKLLKTVLMDGPYGLAVKNRIVYVCDGIGGIKVYNANILDRVVFLKVLGNTMPYDCIIDNNILYVTAQDGILIYDITNPAAPVKLHIIR